MFKSLASLLLLFFCTTAVSQQHDWLFEYADRIKASAITHNLPGYTFVYVEKGKPAITFTYGKSNRSGDLIDEETVFRLASVSKTFTAMTVARLADRQQLSWHTPIAALAPEAGFGIADKHKLNLGHVIGQSSGYMPNAYDNLIEANYPLQRVLNELADLEPLCSPGQCYTYQNALFGVLEHYFQQQNSSYRQAVTEELFSPLAMPNASAGREALLASRKWAKPHIAINRRKWREGSVQKSYYNFSPAAGVNASIEDMTIWLRAMMGEYPHVISPALIEKVTTPMVKTKRELRRRNWRSYLQDAHYGLGWRVYDFNGQRLNYHGGWVQGYRADVAFAPDHQVGFAMLMNAESNLINHFTADFWNSFFQHAEKQSLSAEAASSEPPLISQ